jgi:hypothetical protein
MSETNDDALNIGITRREIENLPQPARLALAYRCSWRVRDPLLANWFDGETMWDHIAFVNKDFLPVVGGLLEGLPLSSKLAECLLELRKGLSDARAAAPRMRTPGVVFLCYSVLLTTAECGLGRRSVMDAIEGAVCTFDLLDPQDQRTRKVIRADYIALVKVADGITDQGVLPEGAYTQELWPEGHPAWYNQSLFQKTPSVLLDMLKYAIPEAAKVLLPMLRNRC